MVTRSEHRQRTLRALSQAAIEAMEQDGPDVALGDIADRAGVARRTVYRWVDSKDDLIFIHPRLWLDVFDQAIPTAGVASLKERVQIGAAAVCASVDGDPDPVVRSMRLAMAHPQLLRGYSAVNQDWVDRMASEVRGDGEDPAERFRSRVIGAALMGVIDAALFEWVAREPRPLLADLVAAGLDHLSPLLEEDCQVSIK